MQRKRIQYQEQINGILEKRRTYIVLISFSLDSIANFNGFHFISEENIAFLSSFRRYEAIFTEECQRWSDEKKVRFYSENCAPLSMKEFSFFEYPRKVSFYETLSVLWKIFDVRNSLFYTRWPRMNLTKDKS